MAATTIAAAVAGTAAAAAYLNAKLHISSDLSRSPPNPAEILEFLTERVKSGRSTLYSDLEGWARLDRPGHVFLIVDGREWTYKQFYDAVNGAANWLMRDLGIKRGEMVALSGPNSAEYMILWFALVGIGATQSFINHNLTGGALEHCVKLCEARIMLADRETSSRLEPSRSVLEEAGAQIVYYDENVLTANSTDTTPIPKERTFGIRPEEIAALIYTSGTTGNPKGVIMPYGRCLNGARSFSTYLKLTPRDRFYTCLPLYHAAAQGLCVTPTLFVGGSVILGRKFSHRTFWPEVVNGKANRIQYVGELCRYLVNSQPHPLERKHCVEEAWGNGMRPDVWERFRERFNIPVIHELYAASDGLGATFNRNRGAFSANAIAVRGYLWNRAMGDKEVRVRIDPDTEEIVRGKDGWVIKSGVNEPGEVLHQVDPAMKAQMFRGYFKNATSTEKRWLTDVFQKGDLWFRSGDMMRQDADGRLYFVDRLGDTFRWKSENVSTNEVADTLGGFHQIAETNVYGVAVPHADGRCGCATVVLQDGLKPADLDRVALARYVLAKLPRYAVPVFLRVTPALSYTGTFKIQKGQAKREGIDVDLISKGPAKDDLLLWLPPDGDKYEVYGKEQWEALKSGSVKI